MDTERYRCLTGAVLRSRRLPWVAAVLAAVLTLPSLGVGWIVDDHWHRLALTGGHDSFGPGVLKSGSLMELFSFMDGDPARNHELMDLGVLPWWSDDELRGAFCRPVTVLTHWLDYRLWPDRAVFMHAQSVLWYAALVGLVGVFYRRTCDAAWVAGLAALLFAMDDGHGTPVGFLANRNALVAGVLGVSALILHDVWRRGGRRIAGILAPVLLAACLFAKESGVSTGGYLLAYAMFLDRGCARERVWSLLPYVGVIVAWRWVWAALGYGISAGVEFYIDPLAEPFRYLCSALQRAPLLLMGQLGLSADIYLPVQTSFPVALPWVVAGSALFVLVVGAVAAPIVWHDRVARFFVSGAVLSLAPACAAFPSDRLLVFVGIGASGVVAVLFGALGDRSRWPSGRVRRVVTLALCAFLAVRLVVVSPAALAVRSAHPMGPRTFMEQFHVHTPMDELVAEQSVVIVTAPIVMFAAQLPAIRATQGLPVPKHTRCISPSGAMVTLRRADDRTVVVRPDDGYLAWIGDQLFRGPTRPLSAGDRVELTDVIITILLLTADGRPAEVAFRFTVPLEDPSLRWLRWDDPTRTFVAFSPPPVGASVRLHGGGI